MIHLQRNGKTKIKNDFSLLHTCLSIIILSFFVFLTVNSTISPDKRKIAIGSLIGSFGLLKTNISPLYTNKNKDIGWGLIDIGKSKQVYYTILKIINEAKFEKFVYLKRKNGMLLLKSKGSMVFKKGNDNFKNVYLILLNRIYNYLSDVTNLKIKIIAYPDNYLTQGFISKFDLATHRAFKCAYFFIKRGIDKRNIEAYGMGFVPQDNTKLIIYFSGKKYVRKNVNNKIEVKGIEFKVD